MIGKLAPLQKEAEESDNPFAFTAKYHTGIPLIDEEHAKLFAIIRDANDLIHAEFLYDKYDEIIHIIDALKDYTIFHFHDEEAYMEQIHYSGLDAQKRAHSVFIERLEEIDLSRLEEIDANQQGYLIELIDFLLGWLTNHILKMDKAISQ